MVRLQKVETSSSGYHHLFVTAIEIVGMGLEQGQETYHPIDLFNHAVC
jgi:hypothetical protein